MSILKTSFALVLFLSACEAYGPEPDVQPLLTAPAPASMPTIIEAPESQPNPATPTPALSLTVPPAITTIQTATRTPAEVAFIKGQLNALQPRSITEDREYCGYLGRLPNGDFTISTPKRGAPAGCTPDNPPANMQIIASYHTHAAYAPRFDSEVPSPTDLEGDISEGINGYLSTPGGRLWFTDGGARNTVQICGIGCLIADPRFQPDRDNPVAQSYSLAELRLRLN